MIKKVFLLVLALFSTGSIFAAYNRLGIPDSSEIRANLTEEWFEAPLDVLRENKAQLFYNDIGEEFQVRMEEADDFYYVFVSPHAIVNVTVYTNDGVHTEARDMYPGDAQGSFVLVKNKATQETIQARYYFSKDADVYVQFTPYGKTALADLIIFGNYAARGVSTGLPFSYFCTCSFEEVLNATDKILPWSYVLIQKNVYHSIRQMIAVIDEAVPLIKYTPDAMYNENNELVHISTGKAFKAEELPEGGTVQNLFLSSSGFVKWICDGLVEPVAGSQLKRTPLIQETVTVKETGHMGVLSQKFSLYFSLDWIRNLASAVISVYAGKNYMFNQSGVDVTVCPFASSVSEVGLSNTVTFIENSGYTNVVLKSLLYVLAATEPGTFYLGAIRQTDRSVTPEVSVFNDNAVFFPYFSDEGLFECAVFENGRKFTLEEYFSHHSQDFVYLTKVKASERFFPAK